MSDIEARIRAILDDVHIESGRKDEHEAVVQRVLQAARQAPASGEVEAVAYVPKRQWQDFMECEVGCDFLRPRMRRHVGDVPIYTHPPAKVPEELWEALADCVSCFNCPEWSDKCEEVERRATKLLNSTTPTPATAAGTEWVKCSESQSDAINHALDVLSKHGDSFTSVGAMRVLEEMLESAPPHHRSSEQ